ncbi:MAG TPA: hypothetical protein VLF90_01590 [Patescibacteria group bacterium]|nr:hypothetical protein [Patescibacteria group bacterium]
MALFKRKSKEAKTSDTNKVPKEVQDYYQAERREHLGMAWLLAFVSLIVTMAVVVGLFFGGRWAYRKLAKKQAQPSTSQTATSTSKSQPKTSPKPANQNPAPTKTTPPATTTQPSQTATPATPKPNQTTTPTPVTTTSPTPQTSTPATQPAKPATSNSSQNLSNTGPGNTVAVFVGVSAVATIAHASYRKRKLNNEA